MILVNLNIWDGVTDDLHACDAIEIKDGQIQRLLSSSTVGDAECRDMGGLFVIPGLIDAHVHMCLDPDIKDPFEQDKYSEAEQLEKIEQRAVLMLAAGITTARDLGGGNWLELAVRDKINAGELLATRLVCAGQPITSVQGHCHFWGGEAADLAEALVVLDRQLEHKVDLIKVMATGGNLTPGSTPANAQFDRATMARIVAVAKSNKRLVAAHCHGTTGIANAASAGVSTIEHCSWVGASGWGQDYDPVAVADMVANEVRVSPTVNANWKRYIGSPAFEQRMMGNLEKIQQAGVHLIASTDAGIPGVYHHHLPLAIPVFAHFAGFNPAQALRSATSECAEAIGLGDEVGKIHPGYSADMVFYTANPLLDLAVLAAPAAVMARGRFSE
jgi:imidazolonepropionase-like amidohydrolase